MISSVNSNASQLSGNNSKYAMSEDQKSAVTEILSKYDAESLSSEDAKEISKSFKELGIRPNQELKESIEASGFDAQNIRALSGGPSGVGGKPPPPPPKQDESDEMSIIEEILSKLLEENNGESSQIMNYTSKIMNLTDEAKDEVQGLFKDLDSQNTQYSQSETSKIMTDSLSKILGEDNNYNHVSYYA